MKLRRLTYKQEVTFWAIFNGANAIGTAINNYYTLSGICIAIGVIMIYLRETYGDIL